MAQSSHSVKTCQNEPERSEQLTADDALGVAPKLSLSIPQPILCINTSSGNKQFPLPTITVTEKDRKLETAAPFGT